jgi:hypothetical protein
MRECKGAGDDLWHVASQEPTLRSKVLVKGGFTFVALALEELGIHKDLKELFQSELAKRLLRRS